MFCAVMCGNFRVVLDSTDGMSIGGNEVSMLLKAAPGVKFVGHSELTSAVSRWHASYVLDDKTLLYASLASVVLRDRIIRPAILAAVNAEAKSFLRSTFPRDNGIFPTYIAAMHSWRFKEEDVWSAISVLETNLCSKKPFNKPMRDWRSDMDSWRLQRRTLAGADIDSDKEDLWIMRYMPRDLLERAMVLAVPQGDG